MRQASPGLWSEKKKAFVPAEVSKSEKNERNRERRQREPQSKRARRNLLGRRRLQAKWLETIRLADGI